MFVGTSNDSEHYMVIVVVEGAVLGKKRSAPEIYCTVRGKRARH